MSNPISIMLKAEEFQAATVCGLCPPTHCLLGLDMHTEERRLLKTFRRRRAKSQQLSILLPSECTV